MPSRAASASIWFWLRVMVRLVSVMAMLKCLPILCLLITWPTLRSIWSAPASLPAAARAAIGSSSAWVASSSSPRLRARSAADAVSLNVQAAMDAAGLSSRMLLQVHDELVFEVAVGERERLEALVREQMGAAAGLNVPLDVSVGTGRSWHDAAR